MSGNSYPILESDDYSKIMSVARDENYEARQRLPDIRIGNHSKIIRGRYKIIHKQDLTNQLKLTI